MSRKNCSQGKSPWETPSSFQLVAANPRMFVLPLLLLRAGGGTGTVPSPSNHRHHSSSRLSSWCRGPQNLEPPMAFAACLTGKSAKGLSGGSAGKWQLPPAHPAPGKPSSSSPVPGTAALQTQQLDASTTKTGGRNRGMPGQCPLLGISNLLCLPQKAPQEPSWWICGLTALGPLELSQKEFRGLLDGQSCEGTRDRRVPATRSIPAPAAGC